MGGHPMTAELAYVHELQHVRAGARTTLARVEAAASAKVLGRLDRMAGLLGELEGLLTSAAARLQSTGGQEQRR